MTIVIRYAILDPLKPYQFDQIYFLKGIMMTSGRRLIWILTLAAFLIMTSGCASSHWRNIEDEIQRDGTGLHEASGQKVEGFQLQDSEPSNYKGWARIVDQDSLSLWTKDSDYKVILGPVYSMDTVDRLDVVQTSTSKTVFYVVGLVALAFGVAAVIYMNSDMEFTANE